VLEHKGGDGAVRELCDLILPRLSGQPSAGGIEPGPSVQKK